MKSFQPKPDVAPSDNGADDPPPPPLKRTSAPAATSETKPEDQPMKGRNAEVDLHGQKRSNATRAATSETDARLYCKGKAKEPKPCHMGHALMERRSRLIV
jgi:hypothetical protein